MRQGCSEHWLPWQDPAAAAHGLQEGGFPELPVRLSCGWVGVEGRQREQGGQASHQLMAKLVRLFQQVLLLSLLGGDTTLGETA